MCVRVRAASAGVWIIRCFCALEFFFHAVLMRMFFFFFYSQLSTFLLRVSLFLVFFADNVKENFVAHLGL